MSTLPFSLVLTENTRLHGAVNILVWGLYFTLNMIIIQVSGFLYTKAKTWLQKKMYFIMCALTLSNYRQEVDEM